MANRRMFSLDIVNSDTFLDLPISSQALYFHLGMRADDRGYVANAKSIIRMLGSTWGDLEQLAQKKFVLIRDEGLILIKGWRINNYIQKDRFVETKFMDDLKKLFFDENNSYTENHTKTPCIQNGYIPDTQDSLDKDSLGYKDRYNDNNDNTSTSFEEQCFNRLIFKKYLTANDDINNKVTYLSMFKLLQSQEGFGKSCIAVALSYFLKNVKDKDLSTIGDKYNYLYTSLKQLCNKIKDKAPSFGDCNYFDSDDETVIFDPNLEDDDD